MENEDEIPGATFPRRQYHFLDTVRSSGSLLDDLSGFFVSQLLCVFQEAVFLAVFTTYLFLMGSFSLDNISWFLVQSGSNTKQQ
jgi:hypothetical protein